MGGTNPDTLFGATITVSWEPAKCSHAPSVVSHTFRIRTGSIYIYRSRNKTLPTGLSFEPLGFPLCPAAHVGHAGCTRVPGTQTPQQN